MNTGEIIKYFRLARNMTQEQLAQDAEISFSTLRKYEANERNPKYEQLSKIADALGISVNLFMDFEIQSVSDLFSVPNGGTGRFRNCNLKGFGGPI